MIKCSLPPALLICFLGLLMLTVSGCGSSKTPSGAVVGRPGVYDYSPSVIQANGVRKFWWCGNDHNPELPSQVSDTILYESINMTTGEKIGPIAVLGETPGTWDAEYTCNPKVVEGVFQNPLGDGQTYTYALYYVATYTHAGTDNSIGVAFSNDGITWNKHKGPILTTTAHASYGVGQPAVLNEDHGSRITMFYEDNSGASRHFKASSTDGVNFSVQGEVTENGLDPLNPSPTWGDLGYDPSTGYWYATYNLGYRPLSTTGNESEFAPYGVELYRIPGSSLLNGTTPWQPLKTVDTNLTGYEVLLLPGLLHDMYGNMEPTQFPGVQLYPSISNPQPVWNASPAGSALAAYLTNWDIGSYLWTPNKPLLPLTRYANLETYDVTTGWIDPAAGFQVDTVLGHLYEEPQGGANLPFYACKNGDTDYFVSLDSACEGQLILGLNGYGYAHPLPGVTTVPLYRCVANGQSHFISHDPKCETRSAGALLGYALP